MNPPYYLCNFEQLEEINKRIQDRIFSSSEQIITQTHDPRPEFTHRRVPSKHIEMNSYKPIKQNTYSPSTHFLPSTSKVPFSGYAYSIDVEHKLRNQFFPKQKDCVYSTYIPSTQSSLYNNHNISIEDDKQTHPLLFKEPNFGLHNPSHIQERRVFMNDTRILTKEYAS